MSVALENMTIKRIEMIQEIESQDKLVFYKSVRGMLLMCRWGGLLPISGLSHGSSRYVRFTWRNFYMVIYVPCLVGNLLKTTFFIYDNFSHEITLTRISNTVFSTTAMISTLLVFSISLKWKKFTNAIEDIEEMIPPLKNAKFVIKFNNIFTVTILILSIVEHSLYLIHTYGTTVECYTQPDDSGLYIKSYHISLNAWLYTYIPYNYFFGFLMQFFVAQATFVWNFTDVLIMGFCIYLIAQFKSFNNFLEENGTKFESKGGITWSRIQVYYTRVSRLVKLVDDHINIFVFVSFSSNLFFICQQLYYFINQSLQKISSEKSTKGCSADKYVGMDLMTTVYLYYSLSFLVMRIFLVSMLAAEIHGISRASLGTLHALPTRVYNSEMQRFMDQVYHCKVGITGLNFFFLTRGLILSVAGTIATYELVLLQIEPKTVS